MIYERIMSNEVVGVISQSKNSRHWFPSPELLVTWKSFLVPQYPMRKDHINHQFVLDIAKGFPQAFKTQPDSISWPLPICLSSSSVYKICIKSAELKDSAEQVSKYHKVKTKDKIMLNIA